MASSIIFFVGIYFLLNVALEGGAVEFNYIDPEEWGSLSPQFELCSSGKQQSPIDIVHAETIVNKTLKTLSRDYHLDDAALVNTGESIKVKVKGKSKFDIDGKRYMLLQVHWHTPSEHLFNGIQYPAELHQVHQAADGSIAVVGILYQYGHPDPLVAKIQPHLHRLVDKNCGDHANHEISLGKFDNEVLRNWSRKYYRYPGSLTTPPCDEHVIWTVLTKVQTMSEEQVASLRAPLCPINKNNSRPVQPLHGRKVQRYDGGD